MLRKLIVLAALIGSAAASPALASGGALEPKKVDYSFSSPLGMFDQAELQRGYKVYREVCSACHAMHLMSFRNLGQKGGPFYDPKYPNPNDNPYVKAIAADIQVGDIDQETGDAIQRPATSADTFPSPFPNEAAARAGNGGALPPDLSVIAKAREGGAAYIYSLLTGYKDAPAGLPVSPGQHYNEYMHGDLSSAWTGDKHHVPPGGFIAMPPPLKAGLVTFDDGTPSTLDQQAKDVSAFLAWAAEPHQDERKQAGVAVLIYLVLFAGLLYWSYRRLWRNIAH